MRAIVFCGGDDDAPRVELPPADLVVAADSGLDRAMQCGVDVDVVVGDLDSVSAAALDHARARNVEIIEYPEAKDATDLALALALAVERGSDDLIVVGGGGARLDHAFGNLTTLARCPARAVTAWIGPALVRVVRDQAELIGRPGELISLFAVAGEARGVSTEGLDYPLEGATLEPGSSWGISNTFTASSAAVSVEEGTLLSIQPHRWER